MYRSWVALVASGVLASVAAVALFAGFGTPWLLAVAVVSGVCSYLAYRYAADRMVQSVYAGVGDPGASDGGQAASDGGTHLGTAEGVDSTTAASEAADGEGEYDAWAWADLDADDPFWSDDEEDWEDPWEANTTAPSEASNGDWRERRGTGDDSERGRWWEERGEQARGRGTAGANGRDGRGRWWERMGEDGATGTESGTGTGVEERSADRTAEAYEVLGLDPGAGPEAVREAYRERVKEAHPDTPGGNSEEFIRVREAYEYLRERLSGTEGPDE